MQLLTVGHFVPYYDPRYFNADKCSAVANFLDRNLLNVKVPPVMCYSSGSSCHWTQQLLAIDKLLTWNKHIQYFNT